jgi:hypothetical protein
VQSLGRTVRPLDQPEIGLGVIGADDAEERIERRCLRPTGSEACDALPHLDPLLLGTTTDADREAWARLAGTISCGLGNDQGSARLMGDVSPRP